MREQMKKCQETEGHLSCYVSDLVTLRGLIHFGPTICIEIAVIIITDYYFHPRKW